MTVHDLVKVAGVTEACKYNDHTVCNNPACSCDCHPWNRSVVVPDPTVINEAKPEKSCPKCGVRRPWHETFCRIDGERLASLLCNVCGAGKNPEDLFCWSCGAGKGAVAPPKAEPVPLAPLDRSEVDYAESVLRNIQAELGGGTSVKEPTEGVATVIESPGGGTFKLVSQPNPNKIRVPTSNNQNGSSPSPSVTPRRIKLPIKPA